jgi:phosphoribosylformylglycinamidine cyclo-ligase
MAGRQRVALALRVGRRETPTLSGIVEPSTVVLAGSAIGMVRPKERLTRANIAHGDAIVVFDSSGTTPRSDAGARDRVRGRPTGTSTPLRDGRTYGEALLDPTHLRPAIEDASTECGHSTPSTSPAMVG